MTSLYRVRLTILAALFASTPFLLSAQAPPSTAPPVMATLHLTLGGGPFAGTHEVQMRSGYACHYGTAPGEQYRVALNNLQQPDDSAVLRQGLVYWYNAHGPSGETSSLNLSVIFGGATGKITDAVRLSNFQAEPGKGTMTMTDSDTSLAITFSGKGDESSGGRVRQVAFKGSIDCAVPRKGVGQ